MDAGDASSAVDAVVAVDASAADAPFRMTRQCGKTYCEWGKEVRDDAYYACSSTCANMPIPNCGRCDDEEYVCEDWEKTECYQRTFAPSKPLTPDVAIESACNRYFDHLDACHQRLTSVTRSDCPTFARIGAPSVAGYFDCRSAQSCDADTMSCTYPSSTLGDDIASIYRTRCGDAAFTEAQRASYNEAGAGLNDAVVAAAKACVTDNACELVASCLTAWWALD